ncbi:Dipeptidase [Gryllus bimaculatus]|nr:Dipeptidase [Gryllus bimaculatus]
MASALAVLWLAAPPTARASPSFMRAASLRGRATLARGSDVLREVPLIDGHNDLPYNLRILLQNKVSQFDFKANLSADPVWSCNSCFTDLPRLRAGRVGGQFWVAYVPCTTQYKDAVEMTLEQIDVIKRLAAAYPNDLSLVTSADGIERAFSEGKIASLIAVEGGHSIDSRMGVLRLFQELGVRYLTLTHSCNTPWADASPEDAKPIPEHNGLTPFGERVVQELNRLGIMVDLSHVSAPTMRAALRVSRAPVIFSHSSSRTVCNHHRNVPDDVLRAVALNNGVVMVNFYSGFVVCENRRATLEDVVDHINYIRMVAGVDHVGIGADYDGVSERVPLPDLLRRLANPLPGEPTWSREDLKKLAGLNLLRVFRDVEKVRDQLQAAGMGPDEEWLPTMDLLSHPTQCLSI